MSGVGRALMRLLRWLLGPTEDHPLPPTRLSEGEAIGLAGAAAERAGLGGFDESREPIFAQVDREERAGPIVWTVLTNADRIGGHIRVRIDDATGQTLGVHHIPR